jgi:hypothetical protein
VSAHRGRHARQWLDDYLGTVVLKPTKGCKLWPFATNSDGYPSVRYNGKVVTVTRLVYEHVVGDLDAGKVVAHDCDNPRCIEPWHLFEATHRINHMDRNQKCRQASGVRNGRAKLTPDAVRDIRASEHVTTRAALARRYGVSPRAIRKVLSGDSWRNEGRTALVSVA